MENPRACYEPAHANARLLDRGSSKTKPRSGGNQPAHESLLNRRLQPCPLPWTSSRSTAPGLNQNADACSKPLTANMRSLWSPGSRCDSGSSAGMRRDSIGARTSGEGSPFSYVGLETRVGENYPLRPIPEIVNDGLAALGDFSALYYDRGRIRLPQWRWGLLKASGGAIC